jgi:prevent-host-death family protein
MKEITIADLEENFDAVFDEVGDGETFTVIGEDGQPLAVLIPYEEYESMNSDLLI